MESPVYVLEALAGVRLAERRAEAARHRLLRPVGNGGGGVRRRLGLALITAGRWLAEGAAAPSGRGAGVPTEGPLG